jgi:hypothetical protein
MSIAGEAGTPGVAAPRRPDNRSPGSVTLQHKKGSEAPRTPPTPDVRLYHRAVVVAQEATGATARRPVSPALLLGFASLPAGPPCRCLRVCLSARRLPIRSFSLPDALRRAARLPAGASTGVRLSGPVCLPASVWG